jgi:peptide chain release factor 2
LIPLKKHTSFSSLDVIPEMEDNVTSTSIRRTCASTPFRSSGLAAARKQDRFGSPDHTYPDEYRRHLPERASQHQNRKPHEGADGQAYGTCKEQEHKASLDELKGDYSQSPGAARSALRIHPYSLVKGPPEQCGSGKCIPVMDGDLDYFINEKLKMKS